MADSFYAARLVPWEEEFTPSEMLILQYEFCARQPVEQLASTYRFLGLDDSFIPTGIDRPVNKSTMKRRLDPKFKRMLVELFEQDVVALAARYSQIDLGLWPNFSYLIDQ